MPLIQKGIEVGVGAIGAKKEKKAAAQAPEGMPEGGAAPKAAGGAEGAQGAAAGAEAKADPIDRFLEMLNSPNIRSIGDIKNFRDQVLQKMQGQGLKPEQMDDAKKKLNQAIIQKLGIGKPGPNGSLAVDLTPQNQQLLQQLGMQPDQVAGGAAGAGAPQPAGAVGAGAQPAGAPVQAGAPPPLPR